MAVQQLFQSGQLDEAVKALTAEVRDNPTDAKRRTLLFELLCFAGEYTRAEKQLDVLSQGGPQSEMGALFYRGALAAEKTRQEMFEKQDYPKPASDAASLHISGTINGKAFHNLADSDPRIGGNLEVFVAGSYMWIPFSLLSSIHIEPPKRLRNLLWLPAAVRTSAAFQGRELGEVLLPVLNPFSWRSADPAIRLGRATAWEQDGSEEALPKGQKMLIADDEEWPLLELRDIEFVIAQAASSATPMPIPEGLLSPFTGENPSGQSLRYDPVYDKIREARRADEELQLSEEASKRDVWTRAVKKADFVQVTKLCTEVLAKRAKDLQIAAWLTEALLAQEKIPGLTQGLDLIRGLLENFWDTVHPEIEDGDLEMRVGPVAWVGSRLDVQVHKVPLTRNKLDWFRFQESRRIGYEADAEGNEAKMAARQAAIEEKKCTAEEFDEAVKNTGEPYFSQLTAELGAAVDSVQSLEALCDAKFGGSAPNFANLKKALEDLQDSVREFWKPAEKEAAPEVAPEDSLESVSGQETGAAAAPPRKRVSAAEQPADPDDAVRGMVALARYLRLANPASPVPYMVLRALRWGELRANASSLDSALLDSPPSETRQLLKKLASESQRTELLDGAETAMSLPCGRGWLDLQRYSVRACEGMGYDSVAAAIRAELRSLLSDYPDLSSASH